MVCDDAHVRSEAAKLDYFSPSLAASLNTYDRPLKYARQPFPSVALQFCVRFSGPCLRPMTPSPFKFK